MSMSRWLKNRIDQEFVGCSTYAANDMFVFFLEQGGGIARYYELNETLRKKTGRQYTGALTARSFVRYGWKSCWVARRVVRQDDLERVEAKRFIGIKDNGSAHFENVLIARIALTRLERYNQIREANSRQEIKWLERVLQEKNRVYDSRLFPPKLRALIWERDQYTCQDCLHPRDVLLRMGRRLTVDHIIEWVDGGKTCYSNGTTLCNVCNIAKHAAKKYLRIIDQF